MPPDHSITDTPPRLSDFPMSLPTPQHDPSPRTSEPSPLLPSPSTPPADSPPRFTSDLKGKRKVQVHQNSPHPGHRRQQSISAPVLILGAPLEKSTYNRENTPPPMDLDRTDTPPPSPRSQHSRPPITYGKRTPISSALLGEITSASSEPKDRSPPSPTPSKPIRALAPSTPELKAGPPLRLFFSVPFKVATPPPDLGGDKLDYFAKHIRGLQISPADDVGRGETVLRTLPLHGVLHTPLLETHCSGCFLDAEHKAKQGRTSLAAARKCFLECMRCQVAVFCSTRWYAKTAQAHFDGCRALKKVGDLPPADVRVIARVCWARANGHSDELPQFPPPSLHVNEMMELAALVKGVSRFLAHLTIETDRAVNVNWK